MPIPIITTHGASAVALMLARAQESNVRARQADAERRILMMQDNWRHIEISYIASLYKSAVVRDAISRRVKRTYNVIQQIANRVCVAYKIPPLRTIGGTDAQKQAFAALNAESRIATKAKTWERYTFACNVVIVVPRVRGSADGQGKRLDYEMILPDRCEVYTDSGDPMGTPTSIAYSTKDGSEFSADPLSYVVLDDEAWHYFDAKGRRIGRVDHGAGIFPGVVFRLADPIDDWWDSHRGAGIVDATIEVAHIAARMDWVRHSQDRKREIFFASNLGAIPFQVAAAEGPLAIPLAPNEASLQVLDVNTPIAAHVDHMRLYLHQAAESIGVPAQLVSFDFEGGAETERTAGQHAALADVRDGHVEWYRQAERDLAWKTSLILRGMGHPSASMLPPDMVRETFGIQFADLLYVEAPVARLANSKERVALGLSSTFREYHREHPSLTFAESRDAVLTMATEEGELNAYYIEHNISRDPASRLKTLAQLQGAQGGKTPPKDALEDDTAEQPGRAPADDADEPTDDD